MKNNMTQNSLAQNKALLIGSGSEDHFANTTSKNDYRKTFVLKGDIEICYPNGSLAMSVSPTVAGLLLSKRKIICLPDGRYLFINTNEKFLSQHGQGRSALVSHALQRSEGFGRKDAAIFSGGSQ